MDSAFGIDLEELSSAFDGNDNANVTTHKHTKFQEKETTQKKNADTDSEGNELSVSYLKKKSVEDNLASFLKRKDVTVDKETPEIKRKKQSLDDAEMEAPRITIYKVESADKCSHEVAVPPGVQYRELQPSSLPPAKTYSFALDPFQKAGILCIDNNQSVLISAHTSAGKTVIAEYAIATALRDKQRVIYTTPIKALSNQKYREFFEEFKEVGLMTGDVSINPNASVLIMTTEILRSMLYRGSPLLREVSWVVFDEIHYMRDKERGVVWEEALILLPDSVRHVFLSATVPNSRQFTEWVACLHHQVCHLVATDYRPTPLQHYIYPAGGEGMHLVVDHTNQFLEDNFESAMTILANPNKSGDSKSGPSRGGKGGNRGGNFKQNENSCFKLIRLVMEQNLEPVIVFSFSKKECEIYALQVAKLTFNTESEKSVVEEVFKNAIDTLSDDDKRLPQVESVLPLLKKGIGIHHSGLLPILKETVEILFSEGLIKCLFATETFAMGLNMPARTVLFTSARKYDGKSYRWISSGEYIQMSGRAGRRGKDDKGTVILMVDESMPASVGRQLIEGSPDPLNSAFYLSYNMILNLLRVEEINPEFMMERSFFQFQNHASIPSLYQDLKQLRSEIQAISVDDEESVASYFQIKQCLDTFRTDQLAFIRKPKYIVPFMQPGRLIKVMKETDDFGWGVVVSIKKRVTEDRVSAPESFYVVECLLHVVQESAEGQRIRPVTPEDIAANLGEPQVVPIRLECIVAVSAARLFVPQDLRPPAQRLSVLQSIEKVQAKLKGKIPLLDPIHDMKIADEEFAKIQQKAKAFEERLESHWLYEDPRLPDLLKVYEDKERKRSECELLEAALTKKKALIKMEELKARKRVLRRLKFCTEDDVVELKGRVGCEICAGDELLLTELIFDGVFNTLTSAQIAALLSCFVFEEKASEMPSLSEELSAPLRTLQNTARHLARVSNECRQEVDEEVYVDSFKPHLMDIVLAWANGATFIQICGMTDIFEGSIIRSMRLLEELLRQMVNAARTIGNTEMEAKFVDAIVKIKRDIVFAPSLYL